MSSARRKKEEEQKEIAEKRKADARKKREEALAQLEQLSTSLGIEPPLRPLFKKLLIIYKEGKKLSEEAKQLVELSDEEVSAAVSVVPAVKSKEDERAELRRQAFSIPDPPTEPARTSASRSSDPKPSSKERRTTSNKPWLSGSDDSPYVPPPRVPGAVSLSREEARRLAFSLDEPSTTRDKTVAAHATTPSETTSKEQGGDEDGVSSREGQRRQTSSITDTQEEPVIPPNKPWLSGSDAPAYIPPPRAPGSLSREEGRRLAFNLKEPVEPPTRVPSECRPSTSRADDGQQKQNGGRVQNGSSTRPSTLPESRQSTRADDDDTPPSTSKDRDEDEEANKGNESPGYSPTSPSYSAAASPGYSPESPVYDDTPTKKKRAVSREPSSPTSPESPPLASTNRSSSIRDHPAEYYPSSPILSDGEDNAAPRARASPRLSADTERASPIYEPCSPSYDDDPKETMEAERNGQVHHPVNGSTSQEAAEDDDEVEIIEVAPPLLKKARADDESQSAANDERPLLHNAQVEAKVEEVNELRRKLDEIRRLKKEAELKRREKHGASWKPSRRKDEMVGGQQGSDALPSTSWGQQHPGNGFDRFPPSLNPINYQQPNMYPMQGVSNVSYRPPNAPPISASTISPPGVFSDHARQTHTAPPLQMIPPLYPNQGFPSFASHPQNGFNGWPMMNNSPQNPSHNRRESLVCPLCSFPHLPEDCNEYRSGTQREYRQRQLQLCPLCLGNHRMSNCHLKQYQLKCMVQGCDEHYTHAALCPVRYPEETSEQRWKKGRERRERDYRDYRDYRR